MNRMNESNKSISYVFFCERERVDLKFMLQSFEEEEEEDFSHGSFSFSPVSKQLREKKDWILIPSSSSLL